MNYKNFFLIGADGIPAIYLPVTKKEKNPNHWYWNSNNPFFQHNTILVTPFVTGMNRTREDFIDAIIYADSGGFQIATQGKRVRVLDILHWQQDIADYGFPVDVPPHVFSKDYTRDQFEKCMKKSNMNAELMRFLKVNDNMQLWAVIQGQTIEELSLWHNSILNKDEYQGFCISLSVHKSGNKAPYIQQLEFAKTIPKPMHFFGYSDNLFVLTLARFSILTGQTYTYDSSTSKIGEMYGKYIHPVTFKHISFSIKDRPSVSYPCDCPICLKYSVKQLMYNTSLINLHNLYIKTKFCKFANLVAQDDELFVYFLNKYIPKNKNHDEIKSKILGLLYNKIPIITSQVVEEKKQSIPKEFHPWL